MLFSWVAWNHLMEETIQLWSTWQWNSTWSSYHDYLNDGDNNDGLDGDMKANNHRICDSK